MPELANNALIIGCGTIGRVLAPRLIAGGATVYATTRSEAKARQLFDLGCRPLLLDVTQPPTLASLGNALQCDELDVYALLPPPRGAALEAVTFWQPLLRSLRHAQVRRAVMSSSSAVYGDHQGRPTTAESDTPPEDQRASRIQWLLDAERLWLDACASHHVVRLAGLYGPGRIPGLSAVAKDAPLLGDPNALLNLIHHDDVARLLLAIMTADAPARIELGADGHPLPRHAYYAHLASRLGKPAPRQLTLEQAQSMGIDTQRLRRTGSKALDPTTTQQRTGWAPMHPDALLAIDQLLDQAHTRAKR